MSSQWGSQKLLQGLVSHELRVYLSVFELFLTQWNGSKPEGGSKPDNFESHKSQTKLYQYLRSLFEFCWM